MNTPASMLLAVLSGLLIASTGRATTDESFEIVEFEARAGNNAMKFKRLYLSTDGTVQTSVHSGNRLSDVCQTVTGTTVVNQWRNWVQELKKVPHPAERGVTEGSAAITEVTHRRAEGTVQVWQGPPTALPQKLRDSISGLRVSVKPVMAPAVHWLTALSVDDATSKALRQAGAVLQPSKAKLAACAPAVQALKTKGLLVPVPDLQSLTKLVGRKLSENSPATSLEHDGQVVQLRLGFAR